MTEESYIKFYYNYDNREKAMDSTLLLSYLIRERVSFTCKPSDGFIPSIHIKVPGEERASEYLAQYFQENTKKFEDQCEEIKASSLEKKAVVAEKS